MSYEPRPAPAVPPVVDALPLAVFELAAVTSEGTPIAQADQPLTIMVWYDPGQLNAASERAVQFYFFDVGGVWVALPTTVDATNHTAAATVTHFTTVGLFATSAPVPALTASPTGTPTVTSTPTSTPVARATFPATGDRAAVYFPIMGRGAVAGW